jgi:hypothetical protein
MRNPFYINKNPAPYYFRLLFGLAEVFGGLVMLLSLGTVGCSLTLEVARAGAKASFKRLRGQCSTTVKESL